MTSTPTTRTAFAPAFDPASGAASAVWAAAGGLALWLGLGAAAPAVAIGDWCAMTGTPAEGFGHCALCWGGAAALALSAIQAVAAFRKG